MLNKVMIIGRLGADPELRYMPSGDAITNLNVATDESYMDKDGNKVDKTEWHRVVVFKRQAENCASFLGKGSLVYVEGKLQTRKWQDQQGQDRYVTEINAQRVQFLDRKGDRQEGALNNTDGQSYSSKTRPQQKNAGNSARDSISNGSKWEDNAPAKEKKAVSGASDNIPDPEIAPAGSEADMDKVPF